MNSLSKNDLVLSLIPGIVLTGFASFFVWRWHQVPTTSWRGGGFGMYADALDERGRSVRVYVFQKAWREIALPAVFKARLTNAKLTPSRKNIFAFSDYLACNQMIISEYPGVSKIRVEYWEMRFEPGKDRVRMIRKLRFERETCS